MFKQPLKISIIKIKSKIIQKKYNIKIIYFNRLKIC